ncbi:MAG TPA: RAMP superfamily CRISPR-associated protein [Chloroflexota bacterium]
MHKTRYNVAQLHLEIVPRGPLLVKAGGFSPNPTLPDMSFVRTYRPDVGETVYLPGSSVKGVVRGFVEKVLRTLGEVSGWRRACATFPNDEQSCAKRIETAEERETEAGKRKNWGSFVYREACGACRLFGHTRLRGRVAFSDFFPVGEVKTETRHGVAISRLSHAVAQGPFEMEVAVAGAFQGRVVLENYELWQLGLLGLAFRAMSEGLVRMGYGKNRGFGEVEVRVREAGVEELAPPSDGLRGLGAFVGEDARRGYGLSAPHMVEGLPEPVRVEPLVFSVRRWFDAEGWEVVARRTLEALTG